MAYKSERKDDVDSVINIHLKTQKSWIERVFLKRECVYFIPSTKGSAKCCCGRSESLHFYSKGKLEGSIQWKVLDHTELMPTDAYGTIEFQGGPHPTKAQYVRVAYDTKPDLILQLLQKHWRLELPKLLISVHGGIANFDLQPKLARVFRKGLLKAAKTTGAWIITGGTNTGVMKHVGNALGDTLAQARNNIVTIGIAPWGVVHKRNDLIGKDIVIPYHAIASPKSKSVVLNSNHSYFVLVDNGSTGKYGAEIQLRKRLEKYISQQKITTRSGTKNYSTPVVALILEGGSNTVRTVLERVTDTPPVPVVVCDGSGRAADLLAFTHKYAQDDGTMPEVLRDQLILTVEKTFQYSREQAEKFFIELMLCVKKKELMTLFRMGEGSQDIDLAILTALLKGQNASAPDQLSLALTWDRVDIARSHIFVFGQEWPEGALDQAMMDALVNDRVDFVQLLLENGVSMQKWLTISRLEELYNIKQDPSSTLNFLIKDVKKHVPAGYRCTLFDIGLVIECLMGGAYRANYCRRKFKTIYNAVMKKGYSIGHIIPDVVVPPEAMPGEDVFKYPFNELLVWAVLLKRQKMAMFMWQHGEEALAKALIAMKLYKSMSHEAAQDDLEMDVSEELKGYGKEFDNLAMDLLDYCYKTDDDLTQQLLTYELQNWSNQTCLSLAVAAKHRDFIAHTGCQILLTEMWMGGLRMRKYTSLKVIIGMLILPTIPFLEFKTKEELQLMPQTLEEHIQDQEDSDSDSDDLDNASISHEQRKEEDERALNPSGTDSKNPTPNGSLLHPELAFMSFRKKHTTTLRLGKKLYEFYTAPITKFWSQTAGFIVFLCIFTYVVLIKMATTPSWQESYVIAYVLTFAIEKCREIVASEPVKFSQKVTVFFSEVWNLCDMIAVLLFLLGFFIRISHPELMLHGRVFYCIDILFWYIRILDIFSVNKYLGPYVMMIGKMVKDMVKFIVILLIVMMSFGITRQALRYPFAEPSWSLARDIYLEPYFMIYGEVYADSIDPQCDDINYPCVPGTWLVPAVMAIYLIVANILLINLLIAVFNNTFHQVNAISNQIWKFLRYNLVIEYESKPILPPPFIFFCHIFIFIKYIIRRCKRKREYFDNGLKLFLSDNDVEKVHDFEEECVEDYYRSKGSQLSCSTEERIRVTNEKVENISLRMDDMNQRENSVKLSLNTIDFRLAKLEEMMIQTTSAVLTMQQMFTAQQPAAPVPSTGQTISLNRCSHLATHLSTESEPISLSAPVKGRRGKKFVKKRMNEARLGPFTDYRPPFSRAITIAGPGDLSELTYQTSLASTISSSSDVDEELLLESTLYSRRRNKAIERLRAQGLFGSLSQSDLPSNLKKSRVAKKISHVTFSNPPSTDTSPFDGQVNTLGIPPWKQEDCLDKAGSNSKPTTRSDPEPTSLSGPFLPSSPPINIPFSSPTQNSPIIPVSSSSNTSLAGINPIVTPVRNEYTSITDDIDTTGMKLGSPPGSPTTPHPFYFGVDVNLDLYTKKNSNSKNPTIAAKSIDEALKWAEEHEHNEMQSTIMKRIRQLSLTETDSMSEIARHVMMEMELSDNADSDDQLYLSDQDIPTTKTKLSKAPSEPYLNVTEAKPTTRRIVSMDEKTQPIKSNETSSQPTQPVVVYTNSGDHN